MPMSFKKRPLEHEGVAFLLAQVGAHAAAKFAERLQRLKLTPADAGILRIISRGSNPSQQALADRLGMFPSRLVLLLDELEAAGLVERRASASDRRVVALHLTARGTRTLEQIGRVAQEHRADLCAALTERERASLARLLAKIAAQQKMTPGVHPGYARWRRDT